MIPKCRFYAHSILSLAIAFSMTSGCKLTKPTQWAVETHSLDNVHLLYSKVPNRKGEKPRNVYVQLMGNGYLSYSDDGQRRAQDSFWDQKVIPGWHGTVTDNTVIGELAVQAIFQRVVDAGFFDRGFNKMQSEENKKLLVFASINGRQNSTHTDEEELLDIFYDLLDMFR